MSRECGNRYKLWKRGRYQNPDSAVDVWKRLWMYMCDIGQWLLWKPEKNSGNMETKENPETRDKHGNKGEHETPKKSEG